MKKETDTCSSINISDTITFIDLIYLIVNDKKGKDLYSFIKKHKDLAQIINTKKVTNNKTALHIAALEKSLPAIKQFLKLDEIKYNVLDIEHNTPLHYACMHNHKQIIKLFIEKDSIDVNIKNKKDLTPLDILIIYGDLESIDILLASPNIDIHHLDSQGLTFLHKATLRDLEIFTRFLEKGININQQNHDGKTALHYASFYKKADIVSLLLSEGADYTISDINEKTALDEANGDAKIINIINDHANNIQLDTEITNITDHTNTQSYELSVAGEILID